MQLKKIAGCFEDCFLESSPVGVICGKNGDEFEEKIPQGYAFYKKIGITAMHITSKEITFLDEMHVMAKTYWRAFYTKEQKSGHIDFEIIYFLRYMNNSYKIFLYITGDEQETLKQYGLV
ncbi:MAG: hypothetical protein V4677_13850 [Bacteroidota bacterium]